MAEDSPFYLSGEFNVADAEAYEFGQALVYEAGRHVLKGLTTAYETRWKPDNTPVTDVDESVQALIVGRILGKYPDDGILAEEEGGRIEGRSGRKWVVDPIDGSQSLDFVPTATICIAAVDNAGQPNFSFIYNPKTDELFAGRRNQAAKLMHAGQEIYLGVSDRDAMKGSYLFLTSQIQPEGLASNGTLYDRFEGQGAKIFNTRSLAYSCCMVAAGKAIGAIIGVKTPFEAASAKLIVEGAGGKVTDLFGAVPTRFDGEINGLVVSNGFVHDQLLLALKVSQDSSNI